MHLKNLSDAAALMLPDDLLWTDEHAWTPAVASTAYLLTGALLVQSASRQAGRPITLTGAVDMAWVPRASVSTLHAWASVPLSAAACRFELTLAEKLYKNVFVHDKYLSLCNFFRSDCVYDN